MKGRVLIVAGSDSGGGAGIQADIKTVTALGGFAMTAITALTAQNTEGVTGIHEVPAAFVAEQMRVVLSDLGADCIKIGMLHRRDVIETVCRTLESDARGVPVVVDPVMVAKGGARLLTAEAVASVRDALIPRATVLTPNAPEAAALTGKRVTNRDEALAAGRALAALGAEWVVMKGGHIDEAGDLIVDLLVHRDGAVRSFEHPRIKSRNTHGTGCTLASAIATGIAQGLAPGDAVDRALRFVEAAIRTAPGFGRGHGPLNHAHTVKPFGVRGDA
ncbi:MAG: bifunctional hydroxymethylpyrimidine kinase/phosphomethylpyrimidine kinase [Rhodospirillales bacterium]|nr:bifunctional hydroxymethylpyrimidine kinase/phosphomethylpyrimidine kinase [Rhodospirillales bacterium]